VTEKTIALRIDVDTSIGFTKGVPRLLKILKDFQVKATFFIVMGPDTMGKHIKRFKEKGYFRRIISVNPFRLLKSYGIKPFFYGTLLPSPSVGESHPELFHQILEEGHEVGIHGYDHARWADFFDTFSGEEVYEEIERCRDLFCEIVGSQPLTSACPNWRCNQVILLEEEKFNFLYLSDVRGDAPFFPLINGRRLATLQIPTTLPTTHECLQAQLATRETVADFILKHYLIEDKLNVFTIHDWLEGLNGHTMVVSFIEGALKLGYRFLRMRDTAELLLSRQENIPEGKIVLKKVMGGIGKVTCQEI
jgi:peptidoglycan/xylan/chitin deacetylase (PgdA/CDA1 family)